MTPAPAVKQVHELSSEDMAKANKALENTKIAMMVSSNAVFFSAVMLAMKHVWDADHPTAYTNGKVIGYNPSFFMETTDAQKVGLMLHETLHVAFMHVCRGSNFDPKRYNIAADYVINLIITDAGFELPDGALYDKQYKDMSTEEVYALLPKKIEPPPNFMLDIVCPGEDEKELDKLKNTLDDILVQAALQSEASEDKPGSVPGDVQFYIDGLLKPIIPWHRLMKSFFTQFTKDDYSYQKINKRFMPDFLLPSLYSEKVCNVAVATDTSGSVTDYQYSHYCSETHSLLRWLKPDMTHFIQFDSTIKSVYELKNLKDFSAVEFTGRGGTRVDPVMQWALENKPACLIVFSDGDFRKPTINPRVPVLWIVHDKPDFKAPFGKVIHFAFTD